MCGLHLIIDYTQALDSNPIQKMLQASTHRGGDGQAWIQQRFPQYQLFMAHNRLAIQQLGADAAQPMHESSSDFCLVYNGEIYNYNSLASKHRLPLKGLSDTEVLLQALMAGIPPEQWEGIYAFACHDARQHRLYIGRDSQGIKPLFFVQNEKYLIVASEISAILASGLVAKKLNKSQIPHYLAYKYAAAPHTFFEGIREVPMRVQCLDLLQKEAVSLKTFYQKPAQSLLLHTDTKALLAHTEALLCEALQKQMQAAVPIGLWLSGGTDSTLLLALLQRLGYADMPCFAVVHPASDHAYSTQDSQFARKAALRFGGRLQEVEISENILLRLDEHLQHMEQPVADTATLLTDVLAAHTSQSCRVALSGAGADELFGGYRRHQALHTLLKLQKKWNSSNIKHLQKLSTSYPQITNYLGRAYRKFLQALQSDSSLTFDTFCRSEIPLRQILDASFCAASPSDDPLRAALDFDLFHYLPQDILRLNDAWGMRHRVEVRVPYLHENIRAFAACLPGELLMRQGRKWLLRKLLEQYGGQAFAARKKEGFGMAWSHWSRQAQWRHLLQPLAQAEQPVYEYIDFERFAPMLRAHLARRADFGPELWAVLVLHRWLQIHFP